MERLLPPSASPQEGAVEDATTARSEVLAAPLRDLWDPTTCPLELLPWLAWALSVDTWRATWPESVKRDVVSASMEVHRRKGTVGSVRRAVEALGPRFGLQEWWEYGGAPYTAKIAAYSADISDDGTGLSPETLTDLLSILTYTAPVRVHFDLEAGALFKDNLGLAGILPRALAVNSAHLRGARADVQLTASVEQGLACILQRPICISTVHLRTSTWV